MNVAGFDLNLLKASTRSTRSAASRMRDSASVRANQP